MVENVRRFIVFVLVLFASTVVVFGEESGQSSPKTTSTTEEFVGIVIYRFFSNAASAITSATKNTSIPLSRVLPW